MTKTVKLIMAGCLALLILPGLALAQANGIQWLNNFDAGLAAAEESGKPIMVDFYTKWCGYCQLLDSNTFTNEEVIELSSNFVCVKIDAESETGRPVASKYSVRDFPRILFLDAHGNVMDEIRGFVQPDQYAEQMSRMIDVGDMEPVEPDALEPNDEFENATELSSGDMLEGLNFHSAEDYDIFEIEMEPGISYTIETHGNVDTQLLMVDAEDEELDFDDDSGEEYNAKLVYMVDDPQTVYITALPYEWNLMDGTYSISLEEMEISEDDYEPNNSIENPATYNSDYIGNFHGPDDTDFVEIDVPENTILAVETISDFDTTITVYKAGEEYLFNDDDGEDYNARVMLGDGFAETFIIEVAPYSWDNTVDNYHLQVEPVIFEGGDDFEPDNFYTQATELVLDSGDSTVSQLQTHTIHQGFDRDIYTIELPPGQPVAIETGGDLDTYMTVMNSNYYIINENDDSAGGYASRLVILSDSPDSTATYYVIIRGYSSDSLGEYTIRAYLTDEEPSPEGGGYYEEGPEAEYYDELSDLIPEDGGYSFLDTAASTNSLEVLSNFFNGEWTYEEDSYMIILQCEGNSFTLIEKEIGEEYQEVTEMQWEFRGISAEEPPFLELVTTVYSIDGESVPEDELDEDTIYFAIIDENTIYVDDLILHRVLE